MAIHHYAPFGPTFVGDGREIARQCRAYEISLARAGDPHYAKVRRDDIIAEDKALSAKFRDDFHRLSVETPAAVVAINARVEAIDAGIKAARAARGLHA